MPSQFVTQWLEQNPDDLIAVNWRTGNPKTRDPLATLKIGRKYPDTLQQDPQFAQDYTTEESRIQRELKEDEIDSAGFLGEFKRTAKGGFPQQLSMAAGGGALAAATAEKIGIPGAKASKDWLLTKYKDIEESAERPLVSNWSDIDSFHKGALFVAGAIGTQTANLLTSVAAGVAGGFGGAAVGSTVPGAGTATGGVGGFLYGLAEKQALTTLIKKGAGKLISDQAKKELLEYSENRLVGGILKGEAAELLKDQTAKQWKNLATKAGATLAAAGSGVPMNAGETFMGLRAAGVEDEDALKTAWLVTVGKTALDLPLDALIVGRVLKGVPKEAAEKTKSAFLHYLSQVPKEVVKNAAVEGPTEAGQAWMDVAAQQFKTMPESEWWKPLTPEALEEIKTSGAVGAITGGAIGPVSAIDFDLADRYTKEMPGDQSRLTPLPTGTPRLSRTGTAAPVTPGVAAPAGTAPAAAPISPATPAPPATAAPSATTGVPTTGADFVTPLTPEQVQTGLVSNPDTEWVPFYSTEYDRMVRDQRNPALNVNGFTPSVPPQHVQTGLETAEQPMAPWPYATTPVEDFLIQARNQAARGAIPTAKESSVVQPEPVVAAPDTAADLQAEPDAEMEAASAAPASVAPSRAAGAGAPAPAGPVKPFQKLIGKTIDSAGTETPLSTEQVAGLIDVGEGASKFSLVPTDTETGPWEDSSTWSEKLNAAKTEQDIDNWNPINRMAIKATAQKKGASGLSNVLSFWSSPDGQHVVAGAVRGNRNNLYVTVFKGIGEDQVVSEQNAKGVVVEKGAKKLEALQNQKLLKRPESTEEEGRPMGVRVKTLNELGYKPVGLMRLKESLKVGANSGFNTVLSVDEFARLREMMRLASQQNVEGAMEREGVADAGLQQVRTALAQATGQSTYGKPQSNELADDEFTALVVQDAVDRAYDDTAGVKGEAEDKGATVSATVLQMSPEEQRASEAATKSYKFEPVTAKNAKKVGGMLFDAITQQKDRQGAPLLDVLARDFPTNRSLALILIRDALQAISDRKYGHLYYEKVQSFILWVKENIRSQNPDATFLELEDSARKYGAALLRDLLTLVRNRKGFASAFEKGVASADAAKAQAGGGQSAGQVQSGSPADAGGTAGGATQAGGAEGSQPGAGAGAAGGNAEAVDAVAHDAAMKSPGVQEKIRRFNDAGIVVDADGVAKDLEGQVIEEEAEREVEDYVHEGFYKFPEDINDLIAKTIKGGKEQEIQARITRLESTVQAFEDYLKDAEVREKNKSRKKKLARPEVSDARWERAVIAVKDLGAGATPEMVDQARLAAISQIDALKPQLTEAKQGRTYIHLPGGWVQITPDIWALLVNKQGKIKAKYARLIQADPDALAHLENQRARADVAALVTQGGTAMAEIRQQVRKINKELKPLYERAVTQLDAAQKARRKALEEQRDLLNAQVTTLYRQIEAKQRSLDRAEKLIEFIDKPLPKSKAALQRRAERRATAGDAPVQPRVTTGATKANRTSVPITAAEMVKNEEAIWGERLETPAAPEPVTATYSMDEIRQILAATMMLPDDAQVAEGIQALPDEVLAGAVEIVKGIDNPIVSERIKGLIPWAKDWAQSLMENGPDARETMEEGFQVRARIGAMMLDLRNTFRYGDRMIAEQGKVKVDSAWMGPEDWARYKEQAAVKWQPPQIGPAPIESKQDRARQFAATVRNLVGQGYTVEMLAPELAQLVGEFGQYWNAGDLIRVAAKAIEDPSASNLVTLFHEAGHAEFASLPFELREIASQVVTGMSDNDLSIPGYQTMETEALEVAEDRLQESTARKLVEAGFDPEQAATLAGTVWRLVAGLAHRVAMWVQTNIFGKPSNALFLSWWENRVKQLLAGDRVNYPFLAWVGGHPMTSLQKAELLLPAGHNVPSWVYDGEQFRIPLRLVDGPMTMPEVLQLPAQWQGPQSNKLGSVAIGGGVDGPAVATQQIAAMNRVLAAQQAGFDRWARLTGNRSSTTLEQLLDLIWNGQAYDATGEKARVNQLLDVSGQPTVSDNATMADVPNEAARVAAENMAAEKLKAELDKADDRVAKANLLARELQDKIDRKQTSLTNKIDKWANAEAQAAEMQMQVQDFLTESFPELLGTVRRGARQLGVLTQTLKELGMTFATPEAGRKVRTALNRLSSETLGEGRLFNLLQEAAEIPTIDWRRDNTAQIGAALDNHFAARFAGMDADNVTLLKSVLIAYGRSNATAMDALATRRAKLEGDRVTLVEALRMARQAGSQEARRYLRNSKAFQFEWEVWLGQPGAPASVAGTSGSEADAYNLADQIRMQNPGATVEVHPGEILAITGKDPRMVQVARAAERLLQGVEQARNDIKTMTAERSRAIDAAAAWQDARPGFVEAMLATERAIGQVDEKLYRFNGEDGEKVNLPKDPTSDVTNPAQVDTVTVSMTDGATPPGQVRDWGFRIEAWLEAERLAGRDKSSTWNGYQHVRDVLLQISDGHHAHPEAVRSTAMNIFGSLVDRLENIGGPSNRVATILRDLVVHMNPKMLNAAEASSKHWASESSKLRRKLGIQMPTLLRRYYDPFNYWLSMNAETLAGATDRKAAFDRLLGQFLDSLSADPDARKHREAIARFLSIRDPHADLAEVHRQMGMKVEGNGYFRDLVGDQYGITMRHMSPQAAAVMEHMRLLGTDVAEVQARQAELDAQLQAQTITQEQYNQQSSELQQKGLWLTDKLTGLGGEEATLAELYEADRDALSDATLRYFDAEIIQKWLTPLLLGPKPLFSKKVGDVWIRCNQANIAQAGRAALTPDGKWSPVVFAEELSVLEGIDPADVPEMVQEVCATLQGWFDNMFRNVRNRLASKVNKLAGMPEPMLDARESEDYPAQFIEYFRPEPHRSRHVITLFAYERAFGRNGQKLFGALANAQREADARRVKFESEISSYTSAGFSRRQAEQKIKASLGDNEYRRLERADQDARALQSVESHVRAMFESQSGLPMELRTVAELIRTVAISIIQGPGTVLVDSISMFEQPLRFMGFSPMFFRQQMAHLEGLTQSAIGSLAGAFHLNLWQDSEYHRFVEEVGGKDPDSSVSFADQLRAAVNDEESSMVARLSRAGRALMSTGFGKGSAWDTWKPHAVFTQFARFWDLIGSWGLYKNLARLADAGVRHMQASPAVMLDASFKFTPDMLKLNKSDARGFEWMTDTLARHGVSLESIAREGVDRLARGESLLSRRVAQVVKAISDEEITLQASVATRPPALVTGKDGFWYMAAPLIGWGISKGAYVSRSARKGVEQHGLVRQLAQRAFWSNMVPYLGILPLGLAYAWLRGQYDEKLLGKKSNVIPISGETNLTTAMLDAFGRVGVFGMPGDFVNSVVNQDTVRPFSIDTRVMFVSSLHGAAKAFSNWINQDGTADWQTVWRPMISTVGGSGYLQWADIINNQLSLDNAEARVTMRINATNNLRAAARGTGIEAKTSRMGDSTATPLKPWIGRMALASYANDPAGFRESWLQARQVALKVGRERNARFSVDEADKQVRSSFRSWHPFSVLRVLPTQMQYTRLLNAMSSGGREAVMSAVRNFDHYAVLIGGNPVKFAE